MKIIEKSHNNFKRYSIGLLVLGFLLGTFLLYSNYNNQADAADATKFNPGNIISDSVFYNHTTMTVSDIQSFLNGKVSSCESGYTCLKNYSAATVTKSADAYCSGYTASSSQTAAQIIYGVSQSCKINPQVLIVLLQKEMGLVTHTGPGSWRYDKAAGFACPDSGACDTQYYGLFNQLYHASRQYRIYQAKASSYNYVAGRNNTILWSPTASCGSSTVYIENQATAGLYNYTPYRPNAAALNAGYGNGDSCSSYGNRNFWLYMQDWFGGGDQARTITSKATASLSLGSQLKPGEMLVSPNGMFTLIMQYSGQLMLYGSRQVLWQSGSIDWNHQDAYLTFQPDGNLVVYKNSTSIWSSGSQGKNGTRLSLQNDGNLVLYTANNVAVWASDTDRSVASTTYLGSTISKDAKISTGDYLRSSDWRYFLVMQSDGNLVLYTAGRTQALWSSDTAGKGGKYVLMQADGNLVMYGDNGAIWASDTDGKGKGIPSLALQSDGNMVLYDTVTYAIWASDTDGKGGKYVLMQADGNLVMYGDSGAIWASDTDGKGGKYVLMQADGNLVMYGDSGAIWASDTDGKPSSSSSFACTTVEPMLTGNRIDLSNSVCSKNNIYKLVFQSDGNLVLYKKKTSSFWASDTDSKFFKSDLNIH